MGTNFRGWLNFAVFEGTSQTTKNNPGEIFCEATPMQEHCRHWARQARECAPSLLSSNHWPLKRNSMCCFPLPSLVHRSTSTIEKDVVITPITNPRKWKTYENLIIKMFQQKREILTLRNFVPIRYEKMKASTCFSHVFLSIHLFLSSLLLS